MKHLLFDPAFPDLVGQLAAARAAQPGRAPNSSGANDNADELDPELTDPLFIVMAQRDIAATRLW
ncbi:MAG TPA: hypothetical protein VM145_07285 [Sphingomicrobium sp.]|nr:hypothetical protein [Sphingomicrobium sp.]